MNTFAMGINKATNITRTENGQLAYKSTNYSKLLDFFAVAGALRGRNENDIKTKMAESFSEDALLATKLLFFLSDVREGLGERSTFRIALKWLAQNYPEVVTMNMELIPHFNRWDSLFVLRGTPCEKEMVAFVKSQLRKDMMAAKTAQSFSLLAKWMPSINTSSVATCELAAWFAKQLNLTSREYRQTLAFLRDRLKVVEVAMADQRWSDVTYEQVPSRAMMTYRKAFGRHDGERFTGYIADVKSGKKEIKAKTLYPYDIIEKVLYGGEDNDVLEAQWNALPDYVNGEFNALVMADVSGSMYGRPMATSVGLALYFAERNKGAFHNLFMTFSGNPEFVRVSGYNLYTKAQNLSRAAWQQNTNLDAAFTKILSLAVQNKVPAADMPKSLIIISDMEIDAACYGSRAWDFLTLQKVKFANYGYTMPNIVFWNVDSRQDTFLADENRPGVQLASGQSASTFKHILNGIDLTPYQAMLDCLNSERYEKVVVPEGLKKVTIKAAVFKMPAKDVRETRKSTIDEVLRRF